MDSRRATGLTRRRALALGAMAATSVPALAVRAQSTRVLTPTGLPARQAPSARHNLVYRNDEEFCAWPFYCGLWQTADGSVLAGFKRVPTSYDSDESVNHENVTRLPGHIVVIRSRDGGVTWDRDGIVEVFDMAIRSAAGFPGGEAADWSSLPPLDFSSRDTLVMGGGMPALMSGSEGAWMRASTDGGRTWRPHTVLPKWDFPAISMPGSSQYSVRPDGTMLFGIMTWAPDALGPRPIVYANPDGRQFNYLGSIIEEAARSPFYPGGSAFAAAPHFYPRVVVLADGTVLASVRYQRDPRGLLWTEIHESLDGGRTWHWLSRVNDWGAPGDLVPMADGRVVCVYGYRLPDGPGIRYRVSEDKGRSWGTEMILRDDGGSWDLGYPRAIETEPGTLLATYYINLASDPIQMNGGVRHIQSTIFRP